MVHKWKHLLTRATAAIIIVVVTIIRTTVATAWKNL